MPRTDLVSPHPIFVFDGHCVLCSTGAAFIMRHDPQGKVRFLSAQSPLGQAIYAHFHLPIDASYLLITGERQTVSRALGFGGHILHLRIGQRRKLSPLQRGAEPVDLIDDRHSITRSFDRCCLGHDDHPHSPPIRIYVRYYLDYRTLGELLHRVM